MAHASLRYPTLLAACLFATVAHATDVTAWIADTAGGLQWTRSDNGHDINYPAAQVYCTQLDLDGGRWRLPTRQELLALFDRDHSPARACGDYRCPLRLPLNLSGPWVWTGEPINAGKAWGVALTVGQPLKLINDYAQEGRALCVRTP